MQKTMNEYYCYLSKAITLHEACKVLGIELIPSGDDYICRCFFHDDEHPSMHLYTESNSYYCFQCGENGNLFSFIKGRLGCSFLESVQWIEKHYPEVLSEKPTIGEQNIDGYEIARNFYCVMSEEEEQGLSVFVKDRKFTRKLLNDAEIYYAKGRKLQHLLNKKDQFIEQTNKLEEKQLLNRVPNQMHHINVERYEDYFKADRIMITLRNDRNEIIGFAGRSIVEQDKPKYLFTKRLDKKHLLYRLNHVKRKYSKDRKLQALYIVEGIFDALRLEKNNQAAVAVLGSHLTQTQTSLIEEYVKSLDCAVTLCVFMDSDEAGLKGNYETIRNLWKRSALRKCNINVNVITSGEKDPDEYYSKRRKEENEGIATYSVFEYLFRYHLRNEETTLAEVDIQEEYSSKTIEEKINISNFPHQKWDLHIEKSIL